MTRNSECRRASVYFNYSSLLSAHLWLAFLLVLQCSSVAELLSHFFFFFLQIITRASKSLRARISIPCHYLHIDHGQLGEARLPNLDRLEVGL